MSHGWENGAIAFTASVKLANGVKSAFLQQLTYV